MEAEEENNDYTGHKILIIGPAEAGKTTFIKRYVTGLYNANALYKRTVGGPPLGIARNSTSLLGNMDFDSEEDSGHKILIIGPRFAGKTTFITRYVHGHYNVRAAYRETVGVDFALKHIDMEDGRHITLQLWDIAGQERTQMMSRMYYQDAHACVIMFDITYEKSLEICLQWKKDLDSKCTLDNGDPIPCILLANKVDLAGRRRFSTEEIEQFARENNFIHFMETSVKENINVEESMQYLVKNLLQHEDLPRPRQRDSSDPVLTNQPSSKSKDKNGCCS